MAFEATLSSIPALRLEFILTKIFWVGNFIKKKGRPADRCQRGRPLSDSGAEKVPKPLPDFPAQQGHGHNGYDGDEGDDQSVLG